MNRVNTDWFSDEGAPATAVPVNDRLDSWKEIAAYVRRGVRTVQRWERDSGLPVHRLSRDKRSVVFAFRSEIDDWWAAQCVEAAEVEPPATPAPTVNAEDSTAGRHRWFMASPSLLFILAVVFGVSVWVLVSDRPRVPNSPVRQAVLPSALEHPGAPS